MAQREVIAMKAAESAGIPVPEVHAEVMSDDRPAILLSWMPGQPLAHALVARPWHAWNYGQALGRTQAALHSVPAPASLFHPVPWVEWGNPDSALRDRLLALEGPDALLHLDLHAMNVLVERGNICAVLDWANARAGDPRADLARTASILLFAPLGGVFLPPISHFVRRAFEAGWRRGYRKIAGPVRGMAPFYAWAGLVMVNDLAPRLGRPDLPWLTPQYVERVQNWTAGWRARANLPNPSRS